MKIKTLPDYSFALKEVFSGVLLISPDKEEFGICMRDSGFEFQYAGIWYEAKRGVINLLGGKPLLEGAKNTEQANQPDSGKEPSQVISMFYGRFSRISTGRLYGHTPSPGGGMYGILRLHVKRS